MTIYCCCICVSSSPVYKCPKCRAPFCSVRCSKTHKTKGCEPLPAVKNDPEPGRMTHYPTDDSIPREKLEMLNNIAAVRDCLRNPHLRQILKAIDSSGNPTDLLAQAMLEPIFMEFATECLKVVQSDEEERNPLPSRTTEWCAKQW